MVVMVNLVMNSQHMEKSLHTVIYKKKQVHKQGDPGLGINLSF